LIERALGAAKRLAPNSIVEIHASNAAIRIVLDTGSSVVEYDPADYAHIKL
jgi:hypothetical protein